MGLVEDVFVSVAVMGPAMMLQLLKAVNRLLVPST